MSWKNCSLLEADDSDQATCFDPPQPNLAYQTSAALLGAGDTVSLGVLQAGNVGIAAGAIALQTAGTALAAVADVAHKVASDIGVTVGGINGLSHANEPQYDETPTLRSSASCTVRASPKRSTTNIWATIRAMAARWRWRPRTVRRLLPCKIRRPPPQRASAVPVGPAPGISPGGSGQTAPPEITMTSDDEQVVTDAPDTATTTDEVATSTDVAASTTAPSTPVVTAFRPSGSPVVDTFDSYDGSGWTPFGDRGIDFRCGNRQNIPSASSGGCLKTNEHIDHDSLDEGKRMYQTGAPKDEGSLTIWVKHHMGFQGSSGYVSVCVGAPGTKCDGIPLNFTFASSDQDIWHEYYFAWRDDGSDKEILQTRR